MLHFRQSQSRIVVNTEGGCQKTIRMVADRYCNGNILKCSFCFIDN